MKERYFIKDNIWITKGFSRSLIVNGSNGEYLLIPISISEILSRESFSRDDFQTDYEFFDYFLEKKIISLIEHSKNFNRINYNLDNQDFESPSTFIIDIDKFSNINLLIKRFEESIQKFDYFQVRVYEPNDDLEKLFKVINSISLKGFEVAINEKVDYKYLLDNYPKLYFLQMFSQPASKFEIDGIRIVEFIEIELKNENNCGNVCVKNFVFNSHFKTISNNGNSCLKNKFSIDKNGNYKMCPSFKESYGNIIEDSLESAQCSFNSSSSRTIVDIKKSEIEVCKDCEFREVCVDCRAYRTDNNVYSKPSKCNYNPYLAKWISLLFFIFFINGVFFSQQNTITVIDSISKTPVPFCKIFFKKESMVFYTDEKGKLPISSPILFGDTLILMEYGYSKKEIVYQQRDTNQQIFVIPNRKTIELDEVFIKPKNWNHTTLNNFKKPDFGNLRLQGGGIIASYIHNSKFTDGRIKSVNLFLKNLDSAYLLKMKLFEYDAIKNCPGRELQISDYFVDFTNESKWYTIDLQDTILIPVNGICVGFEAVPKSNMIVINTKQCDISSVIFGSFYEKLENGYRTSFTTYKSNEWYTFYSKDPKVDNVLNLAITLDLFGELNLPETKKPKLMSSRKVSKKLNKNKTQYKLYHFTIEQLFESLLLCIETNNLEGISELIEIEKSYRKDFNDFLNQNSEIWLTEKEKEDALLEWNYFLLNLRNSKINFMSDNYYIIEFPNKSNLVLLKSNDGWKISPYYKKLVH